MPYYDGTNSDAISGKQIRGRAYTKEPFPLLSNGSLFSSIPIGGGDDYGESYAVIDSAQGKISGNYGGIYDYGSDFKTELTQNLPFYSLLNDNSVSTPINYGDILDLSGLSLGSSSLFLDEETLITVLGLAQLNYNPSKGIDYSALDAVHIKVDSSSIGFNAEGQLTGLNVDNQTIIKSGGSAKLNHNASKGLGYNSTDNVYVKVDNATISFDESGQLKANAAGSQSETVFVMIMNSLVYDRPGVTGVSSYICRKVGSNTPEAFDNTVAYEPGECVIFGNTVYIARTGYVFTGSPMNNPDVDTNNWSESDEISVRIWSKGATYVDMRNYIPWLKQGMVYPVLEYDGEYYFTEYFMYIGEAGYGTIIVDEQTLQVNIAVGDRA